MMTNCFSAMAGFGPGWILTLSLIAVAVTVTYLLTKRQDASYDGVNTRDSSAV